MPPNRPSAPEDEEVAASDEMMEEEAAMPVAPSLPNPASRVEEPDDSPFPRKIKVRRTVTVVRRPLVEHESSDSDEYDESPKAVDADEKMKKETATVVKAGDQRKAAVRDGKKRKINEAKLARSEKSDAKLTECMKNESAVEESKTQGRRKVFTEESEEKLLKGMAEFYAKNGKDFMADQDGFYEYVREKFDGESRPQLTTKKYDRRDEEVRNGEVLEPCRQELCELSNKVWGCGGEKSVINGRSGVTAKLNGQRKSAQTEHFFKTEKKENVPTSENIEAESGDVSLSRLVDIVKRITDFGCGLNSELLIKGLGLTEKSKRVEMVRQWEMLLRDESELNLRRLELVHEQGQLAIDALKASSH